MLKQYVSVDATVLDAYAHLIYNITFYADGTEERTHFSFKLPHGAVISHLQLIENDRTQVSHIAPMTPQKELSPVGIVRKDDDEYMLTTDIMPNKGTVNAIIVAYAPMTLLKHGARLVIPNPYSQAEINIKVLEETDRKSTVSSPTHSVEKSGENSKIISDAYSRDILIDILYGEERRNFGYITHTKDDENIGYFRLKLPERKEDKIGVLFILDTSFEMPEYRLEKAKEGILATLQGFLPDRLFNVALVSGDTEYFSDNMTECTDENICALKDWLSDVSLRYGASSQGFKDIKEKFKEGDVIPVFITSPEITSWAPIIRYNKDLGGSGMGILTLSDISPHKSITAAADFLGGYTRHIYMGKNFTSAFNCAIDDIVCASTLKYRLMPDFDGEAYICNEGIFGGDYLSFLVKFHGKVHTDFIIEGQGERVRIDAENIISASDYDFIKLLYGEASIKKLRSMLYKTTPSSYKRILSQIQYDALKYGVLTEETALKIKENDGSGKDNYIQIENRPLNGDFTEIKSHFSEPKKDEKVIFSLYTAVSFLLENVRSSGAITNSQKLSVVLVQTAYALSALSMWAYDKKEFLPIISEAKAFLKPYENEDNIIKYAIEAAEKCTLGDKAFPPPTDMRLSVYDKIIEASNYLFYKG